MKFNSYKPFIKVVKAVNKDPNDFELIENTFLETVTMARKIHRAGVYNRRLDEIGMYKEKKYRVNYAKPNPYSK